MRGKFITFEGCEGAGKSRQISMLAKALTKRGKDFIVTREPGGSYIAEKIRQLILDADNKNMTDECEALLYAAARVQHLSDTVEPALKAGKLVICDRYLDSSFAYQAYARGLGDEFIASVNKHAIEKYTPDLTLFLNISARQAFARKGGADSNDRLEMSGQDFHDKVYEGYIRLAEKYPERFKCIYSLGEREQTHLNIIAELEKNGII